MAAPIWLAFFSSKMVRRPAGWEACLCYFLRKKIKRPADLCGFNFNGQACRVLFGA
jgi:hypothetical protein